ncbi:MAG: thioredoxin domain-containing protein [Pirellulales bacterium]
MPNHLASESSPYLLQHRNNPVDWYPWGEAAIEKARREEKPIFLSIGYSACHWCHVMEHESFESEEIARVLNEHFVSVKVDREERPDLDQIYMNAVQMLTGRGGWPMSVFLTPELKPFYGGTYWPPTGRHGMPGFDQILAAVIDAWKNRREHAITAADQLTEEIQKVGAAEGGGDADSLSLDLIGAAVNQLGRIFDSTFGGFGQAPKFPHPMDLQLLLAAYSRNREAALLDMVRLTLDRMAAGGIYDHLGGGFARYSVDARWLVPHFEKMLYDNALLARAYTDAYLVTGEANYARVVRETLDYVLRDMTDPAGGFYSTEDADSEGEEGLFYTWTPDEIDAVLGEERGATFGRVFDVSDIGNFEGRSILNLPKTLKQCAKLLKRTPEDLAEELAESKRGLFAVREKRVHPSKDDKVIVAWNGLMIDAMARASAALDDAADFLFAAHAAADFILENMRREDGRLLHTWRNGTAKLDGYLDDYTTFANALVSLYEVSTNERYLNEAVALTDLVIEKFSDSECGGFFYTASDHETLLTRTKELTDSSVPSGNAMAATVLIRLGKLLGRQDYLDSAALTLATAATTMQRAPMAAGQMLLALDPFVGPSRELVLIGNFEKQTALDAWGELQTRYLPRTVIAIRSSEPDPNVPHSSRLDDLFVGKASPDGEPVLYVCENFACQEPAVGLAAISAAIEKLS